MLTKNQIKYISTLNTKKSREELGFFCAEGVKIVSELLNQDKFKISSIFATEEWINSNVKIIQKKKLDINLVSQTELKKISQLTTPNQIIAIVFLAKNNIFDIKFEEELVLVLDEIKDPGNMGTIIRIADWFGIKSIVCSDNTVDIYNSKVIQSTMGSFLRVNLYYTSIIDFISKNKTKSKVYGALLEGKSIYYQDLPSNGILIVGNESKGISKEIIELIDYKINIPSFAINKERAESLNASIATAIICSEFRRNNL
jgi:TrmH family RNA methyltransferase